MSVSRLDWGDLLAAQLNTPDSLAIRLERMILSNQLREGDRLPPERELASQAGVSRSTLREALRALELRGLLEHKQGRGTHVRAVADSRHAAAIAAGLDVDQMDLLNVMEVRASVEPPVAALAAARATPVDIVQLQQIIKDMAVTTTPAAFAELDRLFHRTIAQYTYNPMLVRLLDRVNEIIEVSRQDHFLSKSRQRSSLEEHRAIVDAIAARDRDLAFDAAHRHVRSIQDRLLSQLEGERGAPGGD